MSITVSGEKETNVDGWISHLRLWSRDQGFWSRAHIDRVVGHDLEAQAYWATMKALQNCGPQAVQPASQVAEPAGQSRMLGKAKAI